MKSIILLHFLSLVLLQLAAQPKTVSIHGIVKDTTLKSIEITHVTDASLTKFENTKLNVENGTFNTSTELPFPTEIGISCGNRTFFRNYIYGDAEILIDSAGEPHVIGSQIQHEYENEFLPFFKSNDELFDSAISISQRNHEMYGDDFPKPVKDSLNILK